eukprot:15466000-Alexandrium_andersonii.AAC.1
MFPDTFGCPEVVLVVALARLDREGAFDVSLLLGVEEARVCGVHRGGDVWPLASLAAGGSR